jgi:hypothetical protein
MSIRLKMVRRAADAFGAQAKMLSAEVEKFLATVRAA